MTNQLGGYRAALETTNAAADQLLEIRALAIKITASLGGVGGNGPSNNRLARAVEGIDAAEQRLEQQITQCMQAQKEVLLLIGKISDKQERAILRRRYLNGESFVQMAAHLTLDERWVRRLHRRAVEQLCQTPMEKAKRGRPHKAAKEVEAK